MLREDNVIDNKEIVLKDELENILPETETARIAVGYFFISGLSTIIKPLKDTTKIQLLISNTTDKITAEALIEGFHSIEKTSSAVAKINHVNKDRKDQIRSDSKVNTKQSLEYMSQTTQEKTVVESLIEMIKTKQLEVRVYPKEKLHAKAYIFEPKNTKFAQGMGIVGSSNLSIAGISHNSELNLKTYNAPDVNQLLKWFDSLWEDGLDFTEDFALILQNSWAGKMYSPKEVFLKGAYLEYSERLEEQHEIDPIWEQTFPKLFPFQKDAVDQGLTLFELYGGIIIGDVVGLGKTYIGIALLKYLQRHEYRPLIICPPPLIPMWEKFCEEYEVDAKVLSRGKLSQEKFEMYKDYRYKSRDLVLIDESHHFRNSNSRQYENLQQFMQAQGARAILLTATPYSNKATDIKNQIMLFHHTPQTSIPPANETDLDKYFMQVKRGEASLIDLLRNIMIRRTRRYVLKQWGQDDEDGRRYLLVGNERKYFPQRTMETERYDINKVYQRKYNTIVKYLSRPKPDVNSKTLTLARYSLGLYLREEYKEIELYRELGSAGEKLITLIRSLLLKRMESSLDAFKHSIKHYINTHKIFLRLLEEKIIPIGDVSYKEMYEIAKSDPESIYEPETIEGFKKKMQESGETKYKFEAFDIESLARDIQNDMEIFETVYGLIHGLTEKTDDKLHRLQSLLDKEYSGKKILVFSEFADTTRYLDKHLRWTGKKEQIDSASGNSVECARRFDPDNNPGADSLDKSEQTSLLISTDVLAEGVNLQAGQVVVNYDFHWNPTRLIQRAGRVDRIGSKNEYVIIHNFLLDENMEKDFRLEACVDAKIDSIQQIIGEDYKILKKDEEINEADLYAIYSRDESILEREEENPLEPSEFENTLQDIKIKQPEFWEKLKSIPDGIRSSDHIRTGGNLLLACETGAGHAGNIRKYYLITPKEEITEVNSQKALDMLRSEDNATYFAPSDYDKLVSVGWNRFVEDAEQIQARTLTPKLELGQRWIIEKLVKMDGSEFSDKRDWIDTLRKAYFIPITKGKLNKELLKIKKSQMSDSELVDHLGQLYLHYNLQDKVKQNEEDIRPPRILYSKYVGNKS